jgi:hypothetical protein
LKLEIEVPENAHPSSIRFYERLVEMAQLHARKQADYGRTNDPFANVRASEDFGVPSWVGCMIRANDKMRRLQKYAAAGCLSNESADDAFMDLAVYAVIGAVLHEEQTKPR